MEEKVIEELKKGNLVIMPTDTIYGIIADATKEEVIKKSMMLKKEAMTNHY